MKQKFKFSSMYTTHFVIIDVKSLSCLGNGSEGVSMVGRFSPTIHTGLFGILTLKFINLPHLINKRSAFDGDDDIGYCCLSSPPDDPNSIILMTRTEKPHFVFCRLYPKRKKLRWTEMSTGADGFLQFDKPITIFAEEKFHINGIDLRTWEMVTKVSDKEISTKIGQVNIRVLATDEWLRVEGTNSIYALGDYARINQHNVMEDISAIFQKADKDNSRTLTVKEFQEALDDICSYICIFSEFANKLQNKTFFLGREEGDGVPFEESNQDIDYQVCQQESTIYKSALEKSGGRCHLTSGNISLVHDSVNKSDASRLRTSGTSHVSAWAMLDCKRPIPSLYYAIRLWRVWCCKLSKYAILFTVSCEFP
nr:hypothetical protein [Tanacetum cinerariifolium]